MSRSNVYLVSAKQKEHDKSAYENEGFQPTEHKVTYSASNGVDMQEMPRPMPDRPYRGMGKEELLHFSSRPLWRRMRMACISFVLIGWLALIITVVALVLVYPRCREPGARTWWQTEAVYRVYVPSFKDSDDDGIGDLKGVESKLDYIQGLGYNIVSLSPFYSSTGTGAGSSLDDFRAGDDFAIVDHMAVGDRFGTLTNFDDLMAKAHDKGMYVVIDFIPNHTGTGHPWFVDSTNNPTGDKRNFYVWAGTAATAPNNWQSVYDGSAWSNATGGRAEWYLHQFASGTADLNLRSAQVRQQLADILSFWLDRGVDGFNIRNAAYLYEDFDLRDEPTVAGGSANTYSGMEHVYTSSQPEVYGLLEQWRELVNAHNKTNTPKLLMADIDGGLDPTKVYANCDASGIQMPLNRKSVGLSGTCDGTCMTAYVDGWMSDVPSGKWANWLLGDDSSMRATGRFNSSFVRAFVALTYLLPGTPLMYYGDELGAMTTTGPTPSNGWSRDQRNRGVMPWGNVTEGDGFCNCNTTWTPTSHVATGDSVSGLISELMTLRQENSFRVGEYAQALRDSSVVSFVREFDGETGYLVAVNFGSQSVTRDFTGTHDTVPSEGTYVLSLGAEYDVDDDADPSDVTIGPHGVVVISWDYVAKEL